MLKKSIKLLSILLFSFWTHAFVLASEAIHYQIEIDDSIHHQAKVTVLLPQIESSQMDVFIPNWRPGRYQQIPLANGISHMIAKSSQGKPLKIVKMETNHWRIFLEQPSKVELTYRLYANELSDRTRHIDSSHAYLDAVASLVFIPEFRSYPIHLDLDVPKGWKSVSGLKSGWNKNSFVANNYDELVDAPIETGVHEEYHFDVKGIQFELAIWGKGNFNGKNIAQDLAAIVKTHIDFWGNVPFERYLFIVHVFDKGRGATEHKNSSLIQTDSWSFNKRKNYLNFLQTASHEFVHAWNVKAYRPQGLVPYDYLQPNYSKLLWWVEGGTSYLGNLLLLRSGLMTQDEYFNHLAKAIYEYQNRPGRLEQSAADASFNEWIAPDGDRANNAFVNIYSQGKLLSLWLDLQLFQQTDGRASITDVQKKLYQQFPASIKGYTEQNLMDVFQSLGLKDAQKIWDSKVRNSDEMDFNQALKSVGLLLSHEIKTQDKDAQQETKATDKKMAYLGIKLAEKSENNRLEYVLANSPAWDAGITADDELVAINNIKITQANYQQVLQTLEINSRISVNYFRNGLLEQTSLKVGSQFEGKTKIIANPKNSTQQIQQLEKWLGVSLKKKMANKAEADNSEE